MAGERRLSNFEVALRAESKRVERGFHRFDHEQRATHAASFRLGHRQRERTGDTFYTHPDLPGVCFPTRSAAARTALSTKGNGDGK